MMKSIIEAFKKICESRDFIGLSFQMANINSRALEKYPRIYKQNKRLAMITAYEELKQEGFYFHDKDKIELLINGNFKDIK